MDGILAPFQYDFMQRAFLAALVVGALCSAMGTYVVLRKLSFIGDGLAHASFAGIAIAYLRGANFYAGAAAADEAIWAMAGSGALAGSGSGSSTAAGRCRSTRRSACCSPRRSRWASS